MQALLAIRRVFQVGMVVSITLALGPMAAIAQSSGEARIKAAFVHNFLKFVEWPVSAFSGPTDSLVVGILGRGPSSEAAAIFLAGKQVNSRFIAVRRLTDDDAAWKVHAIFIGGSNPKRSQVLVESLLGRGVLIIGESDRFVEDGGSIGMVLEDRRVRFDVNLDAAVAARLRISSKLLALARHVLGENEAPEP